MAISRSFWANPSDLADADTTVFFLAGAFLGTGAFLIAGFLVAAVAAVTLLGTAFLAVTVTALVFTAGAVFLAPPVDALVGVRTAFLIGVAFLTGASFLLVAILGPVFLGVALAEEATRLTEADCGALAAEEAGFFPVTDFLGGTMGCTFQNRFTIGFLRGQAWPWPWAA